MIVRLTHRQFDAVLGTLTGPIYDYLTDRDSIDECHITGAVEWSSIPDAFLFIGLQLMEKCEYGSSPSTALVNAARRIMREVNSYRSHPAFQGISLVESHHEILTGFTNGGDVRPFLQEGRLDSAFVLLVPVPKTVGSQHITTWHRELVMPSYGAVPGGMREAEHRRFQAMVLAPDEYPTLQ